jgi:hypothetical protein
MPRLLLLLLITSGLSHANENGRFHLVSATIYNEVTGESTPGLYRIDTVTGDVDELLVSRATVLDEDGKQQHLIIKGWNRIEGTYFDAIEMITRFQRAVGPKPSDQLIRDNAARAASDYLDSIARNRNGP